MAVEVLPKDGHNAVLVTNVHPPDWVNPEPAPRYNLVVIGAGTAGLVTAAGAAGLGAKVALVERELLGGDCFNVGCVPSKALIRAARAAAQVRDAAQFGIHVPPGVRVDFAGVMERMRRLRTALHTRHGCCVLHTSTRFIARCLVATLSNVGTGTGKPYQRGLRPTL
jgi:2-polyprenyl-6-methoxyphenol hydroxylase-like FAD-dependent oxidoreductase